MLKLETSISLFEESRRYLAGGVGSNARLTAEMSPIYFKKGLGSKVYDVDGNEYIDYVLAWGPLILGHCPPAVVAAVKRQLDAGTIFGSSVQEEVDLSRRICEYMPSMELVRFTNSASEAVHMTLRLARAYTGRTKILKFEGAYHGWFDNILVSTHPEPSGAIGSEDAPCPILDTQGQPREILQEVLVGPWNRADIVEEIIRRCGDEIAALIAEPIMCNNGVIPPVEGFLQSLRELTDKKGIVLIFDETITGFRVSLGGAQGYYQVRPDLTVFGKGMGGGYPIAGFGGKKEIMSLVAEGKVGHFGTYNSNSLCVTAALATLGELSKDGGAVYGRITAMGKKLMKGIEEIFVENRLPLVLQGPGSFFSTLFTDRPIFSYRDTFRLDRTLYSKFWVNLLHEGIRIWPSARGLWYLSSAHTDEDMNRTLDVVSQVVRNLH
ncbi:MAG: aspartate aminotransferase family protein [Thermodesulfobacteriota bacterium]